MPENRYNREYVHGNVTFRLSDFYLNIDECRFLILKIVEQTVRDYMALYEIVSIKDEYIQNMAVTRDEYIFHTAAGFIFDDSYTIWWGDQELTPADLLELVDINIDWFRQKVRERIKKKGIK